MIKPAPSLSSNEDEFFYGAHEGRLMKVMRRPAGSLRGWWKALLILAVFTSHEACADSSPGDNNPLWVTSVCSKFDFSAWDKISAHPPYRLKYVVKRTLYTYTAEKFSDNSGSSPKAKFPDDFVDGSGRPAHLTSSCAVGKMTYEIYVDGTRLEAGEINVGLKVDN
ncbi:hypothetical protein ACMGT0_20550 [Pseudomonas sp. RHF3.3-3]|uniref:hypothetical protein n=1 Tax=Pseudomonas sp. RHF3.3-3 TaxID=3396624 RepID=UPI003A8B7222